MLDDAGVAAQQAVDGLHAKNVVFWSSDTSFMVVILPPTLVSGIIEPLQFDYILRTTMG